VTFTAIFTAFAECKVVANHTFIAILAYIIAAAVLAALRTVSAIAVAVTAPMTVVYLTVSTANTRTVIAPKAEPP